MNPINEWGSGQIIHLPDSGSPCLLHNTYNNLYIVPPVKRWFRCTNLSLIGSYSYDDESVYFIIYRWTH